MQSKWKRRDCELHDRIEYCRSRRRRAFDENDLDPKVIEPGGAWSSERRAAASEAARAPKAASIWASMVLRARPSRPTSVRGSRSGTRRVRSPCLTPMLTPQTAN